MSYFRWNTGSLFQRKTVFESIDEIRAEILEYGKGKSGKVYAFSASMMANVLINDLHPVLGQDNWLIDFGSLWDVYVSVQSRSVYKKLDWEPLIQKNLNG